MDTVKPAVRLQVSVGEIKTFEDADLALGALRLIDARLQRIGATHDTEVQKIQEAKKRRSATLLDQRAELERKLEAFSLAHRDDWGKPKSLKMVHGKIGFRWGSPKVELSQPEDQVVARLKAHGQSGCVKVKESLDRAALKSVPEAILSACGVRVTQDETFYYELKQEKIVDYPQVSDDSTMVID